jgi:hypothetical protein
MLPSRAGEKAGYPKGVDDQSLNEEAANRPETFGYQVSAVQKREMHVEQREIPKRRV